MPNDNQLDLLRLPPHSIEAEQSVLGGLMLENIAWDKIADLIGDDDFYRDDHRRIYKHISKLIEANRPADVITVGESLERNAELESVGGLAYVGMLSINTPSAANIRRYAAREGLSQSDEQGHATGLMQRVRVLAEVLHEEASSLVIGDSALGRANDLLAFRDRRGDRHGIEEPADV